MTEKEILIQSALGTLPAATFYKLLKETTNPKVITAIAEQFVKLDVSKESSIPNGESADEITNLFMNNKYTPQLVKSYVILARQIKNARASKMIQLTHYYHHHYNKDIELMCTKLKELHQQLFKD